MGTTSGIVSSKPSNVLSITHKLGLFFNNLPGGCNILQPLPSTPDSGHARFAISLATKESAQLRNPANRLTDSRDLVWQAFRFVNAHIERFPFDVRQHGCAGQVGLAAVDVGGPV